MPWTGLSVHVHDTAHIFHVGDSRIYRADGTSLEQLTDDHRVVVSSKQSYLGRALGAKQDVEIDYQARPIAEGDLFVLATDGVYEHVEPRFIAAAIRDSADDLDRAARRVVEKALENGSADNLTIQVVRIDRVPAGDAGEAVTRAGDLPLPPLLEPRTLFDGYRIVRQLHASSRSHIYLAADAEDGSLAAIKISSVDQREDAAYRRRFAMEEWVARRIDSAHVLKPRERKRGQRFLYVATEFVEGRTLAQWMADNPRSDLERVRGIVEQIAKDLRAFHRKETLHQDLRPENIMVDETGTVRIIDFGSARVAGVAEAAVSRDAGEILGAAQYAAPEYFLGECGTARSDLFSLGVIAYQMITCRLPYGAVVPRARTRSQQRKLRYRSARDEHRDTPAWVDGALAKAVSVDTQRRYGELSEFVHDLRHPNAEFAAAPRPILERNPLLFWKITSLVLSLERTAGHLGRP